MELIHQETPDIFDNSATNRSVDSAFASLVASFTVRLWRPMLVFAATIATGIFALDAPAA
jgi:hypothetical protein